MQTNETKRLLLASESAGGHKHALQSQATFEYEKGQDVMKFRLKEPAALTHDEHGRMVFGSGRHRSYNQVEVNPLDGSISEIFD